MFKKLLSTICKTLSTLAIITIIMILIAIAYLKLETTATTTWNNINIEIDTSKFNIYKNNDKEFQIGFKNDTPKGALIYAKSDFSSAQDVKNAFIRNGGTILNLITKGENNDLVEVELVSKGDKHYIFSITSLSSGFTCGYIGPKGNYHLFAPIMKKSIYGE